MGLILDKKKFQMDLVLVLWSINEAQVLDNDEHYVLWNERKEAKFVKIKKLDLEEILECFKYLFLYSKIMVPWCYTNFLSISFHFTLVTPIPV